MGKRRAAPAIEGQHGTQAAQGRTVKHGVSRLLPYAPPWLIWFGILLIAVVGRVLWGDSPTQWVSSLYPLATMLSHQGAMLLVWKMTKALNDVLRMLGLASICASMLFSIMVGVVGMTYALWSLWGYVGFTLCMYWTIRRMLLTAQKEAAAGVETGGPVGKLLTALNGAKPGTPQVLEGGQVVQHLEANRGEQDVEELKEYVKAVESVAGMRRGAGRLVTNPDDVGAAKAVFIPQDQLKGIIPWTGPSAFGESIFAPIPVGTYEDMLPAKVWLSGDHDVARAMAQWLIMGMTGAGKSESWSVAMADALTRRDFTLWAHDHVKGIQTLKPFIEAEALDWVSCTLAGGKAMLNEVKRAVFARTRWLGEHDFTQWTPDCGLNLLCVWIEEANKFGSMDALCDLAREARSAGIIIIISLQRASHTTLDTDTRAQLSGNVCFGVESSQDAKFALPEHVIDAGAEPERWRNEKQGYAYLAAPGIDEERAGVPLRFFRADRALMIKAMRDAVAVRRPLAEETDQVTVRALSKVYHNRLPVQAFMPGHPDYQKAIGMEIPGAKPELATTGGDSDSDKPRDAAVDPADHSGSDSIAENTQSDEEEELNDEADAKRIGGKATRVPCPAPDLKVPNAPARRKMTTAQVREAIQQYMGRKAHNNDWEISVPDIEAMEPPISRGREALRNELKRLASGQADPHGYTLTRERGDAPGVYRILPPISR